MSPAAQIHAKISGPIVMIGFGSIGKGTLLLTEGGGQGFCVNLSVDTSSVDIMTLCREIGALYIDTVVEPWAGFYFDKKINPENRSNYALRETLLEAKR